MTRSALAIALLLAGAAGAFADAADPAIGEAAYVKDCTECHASAARIVRKIRGATPEEKAAWLDTFLADHHLADMDRKGDLVAYLLGL